MKKIISLVLVSIMLLTCLPLSVFAADGTWAGTQTISTPTAIADGTTTAVSGSSRTITSVLTIQPSGKLIIKEGATVLVSGNGRIVNQGEIIVESGATLHIAGIGANEADCALKNENIIDIKADASVLIAKSATVFNAGYIKNAERISVIGSLQHQVTFTPKDNGDTVNNNTFASFSWTYKNTEMWNRTETIVNFTSRILKDTELETDLGYTVAANYTNACPNVGWYEHGEKVYILVTADENGSWIDTSRMKLTINGQEATAYATVDNDRGVFCITPTNSIEVSVASLAYKDIVKLFDVTLPKTEGYYVITKDGVVDQATVEFGKTFSFRVVLNPEYDKSKIVVYVNTFAIEPDEYGYYDIQGKEESVGFALAGGVQDDLSIQVMGVAPNERVEQMNNIVSFIKEIFDVFRSIFAYFQDLFAGLFGGSEA